MARQPLVMIYVGIKSSVVALDDRTGSEVWRTKLRGSDFVTVLWDGVALLAANDGEVWRLDPATGSVIWHNPFKGLGRGVISLASARLAAAAAPDADVSRAKRQRDAQQAAAVGAAS